MRTNEEIATRFTDFYNALCLSFVCKDDYNKARASTIADMLVSRVLTAGVFYALWGAYAAIVIVVSAEIITRFLARALARSFARVSYEEASEALDHMKRQ